MPTTAPDAPLATSLAQALVRLAAFEPTAFPVLSVYLNTQPTLVHELFGGEFADDTVILLG